MACPVKIEIQYSDPSVSSGRSNLFGYFLVIVTLIAIPANAPGQSVEDVVTDLSVIADGGIGKKFVFPVARSGGLQMPKGPVHSRLHVIPKKPVSEIRRHTPRKKIIIEPRKKQITEAKKSPTQPVVTPGPKPKVQVVQVPTQKPQSLVKTEKKPPAKPELQNPAPLPTKPEAPPPASAEPAISFEPSQKTVATTEITLKPGRALGVAFEGLATDLSPNAKAKLSNLSNIMRDTKEYRIQLMAFAGGKGLLTSKVRRISLSRALAVRSYLIEKGIRSTQIDVRALGNKTSEKPVNRVDVNLVQR